MININNKYEELGKESGLESTSPHMVNKVDVDSELGAIPADCCTPAAAESHTGSFSRHRLLEHIIHLHIHFTELSHKI